MENINFWIQSLISLLSGLLVLIPLVVKLVKYVRLAAKERNWPNMLSLVMSLMAEAETEFETGAERKNFVLKEIEAMASTLNYDIDLNVVSEMIDAICEASRKINI